MIVFDLKCETGHVFEAWFASSGAFADQQARGLLACPVCGGSDVTKAVMAPNVAAKGNAAPPPPTPTAIKAALKAMAAAQSTALESSEWVGRKFADRARAMHVGDAAHAPIHGEATVAEARALVDEGVTVAALPFPVLPPEALN